jgi:hypothetical protein
VFHPRLVARHSSTSQKELLQRRPTSAVPHTCLPVSAPPSLSSALFSHLLEVCCPWLKCSADGRAKYSLAASPFLPPHL